MSAAKVCGKRCYFEEESESFPLVTKKLRLTPLDRLIETFPKQLCLGHADRKTGLSNAPAGMCTQYYFGSIYFFILLFFSPFGPCLIVHVCHIDSALVTL